MPKVSQTHLEGRRQQIISSARRTFAVRGFARTSMTDLVKASGLSNGAIYRYFSSKDEIIAAICEQSTQDFPAELTRASIGEFLGYIRTLSREENHAKLIAQIYAEAAVLPELAAVVASQYDSLRDSIAALLPHSDPARSTEIAEAFLALCNGYTQQLAIRGDVDPEPITEALVALVALD